MARVYYAPEKTPWFPTGISVFLAGSIDMGRAVEWQEQIITALADHKNLHIYNPRRKDWDPTWAQSIDNPPFYEQVVWELNNIDNADIVVFFFDKDGPAPITLMELGLAAEKKTCIVCCPEGYWRKGNVDIVCQRHGIETVETLEELIETLKIQIEYVYRDQYRDTY